MRDYWAEAWAECQKRNAGFYEHDNYPVRNISVRNAAKAKDDENSFDVPWFEIGEDNDIII